MVEQCVVAEARHFQHRLDKRAVTVPFEPAARCPRQPADSAIELRRGAAIELELGAAEALALGERRIIEKESFTARFILKTRSPTRNTIEICVSIRRGVPVREAEARATRQEIDRLRLVVDWSAQRFS